MALRSPHGRAKEHGSPGPRIEVLPPDELPAPVPGTRQPVDSAEMLESNRAALQLHGRLTKGNASAIAQMGGRAKLGRPSLVSTLGLSKDLEPASDAFRPYRRRANAFRRAHCDSLSLLAGGECGTGPSSLVATASIQLAVSRWLYDAGTKAATPDVSLLKEARQQGDSSRQNLLAAYELAVREAQRRGKKDVDPLTIIETKQRAAAKEAQLDSPADGLA